MGGQRHVRQRHEDRGKAAGAGTGQRQRGGLRRGGGVGALGLSQEGGLRLAVPAHEDDGGDDAVGGGGGDAGRGVEVGRGDALRGSDQSFGVGVAM